jgi:hypothetical protein
MEKKEKQKGAICMSGGPGKLIRLILFELMKNVV